MKTIKVENISEIPENYTGIVDYGDVFKAWFKNGRLHREDGPAIEHANGDREWFKNRLRHREDGPAIELIGGSKQWYLNGQCHREDGPAVEDSNGDKEWCLWDYYMSEKMHSHFVQLVEMGYPKETVYWLVVGKWK